MKTNKLLEEIRASITPEQNERWDKITDKLLNIASTLNKNSFRGYHCEAENSCDKQCKKCEDEK